MAENVPILVQRLRERVEGLTGERGTNPAIRAREHAALREQVAELVKRIEKLEGKA